MYNDFKTANYPQALLSPELFARHLSRLFVGDVIDGLTVSPGTGLQVVLAPGNAFVRYGSSNVASARFVSLVANFSLTIATPDASNPRIDLVVLYTDNAVTLPGGTPSVANLDGKGVSKAKIVQGTPAATPVAPNDTAIQASVGAGNPYTVLAQVRVDQGVSVIASNKITDVRSLAEIGVGVGNRTQTFTSQGANSISLAGLPTGKYIVLAQCRGSGISAGTDASLRISLDGVEQDRAFFNMSSSFVNQVFFYVHSVLRLTSSSNLQVIIGNVPAIPSGRCTLIRIG